MTDSRYASRKFILSLLTLAASTWLVAEGLLDADSYKTIVLGVVGVYVAGNVGQKALVKEEQK